MTNNYPMAWAVEFSQYVYRIIFDCDKCGNCCRHIGEHDKGIIPVKPGTTECLYLADGNICTIYNKRPECCRRYPVYAGGLQHRHDYCPEFRRYYLFYSRRYRRLRNEPYGFYKHPQGKQLVGIRLKGDSRA